jgi:iron complex outermembrane receptor protein
MKKLLPVLFFTSVGIADVSEIVVTANPLQPSLLETSDAVSIMNRDEIIDRNHSTLGETIEHLPGVRSSYFGPGSSRPVIRGFAGDRVTVLRNGVGTGDLSNVSEDHQVTVDPLEAQSIEVLRGPETLLYGSNAIGGAVNVTDNSILESPVGEPLKAEGVFQFGDSADNEKSFGLGLKGEVGSINWKVSGFYRDTKDIEIPGYAESEKLHKLEGHKGREEEEKGILPNSATETGGYTVGASHVWDRGFVGLAFSQYTSQYGIPGGHSHKEEDRHEDDHHHSLNKVGAEHSNKEGPTIDLDQYRVDLRGRVDDLAQDIESIRVKSGLSYYTHDEIEGDGSVATTYDNDSAEIRVDMVHRLFGEGRGVLGAHAHYEDFSAVGEESFVEPTYSYSTALFGFQEIPINDELKYNLGGRVEYVDRDPINLGAKDFVPFSFSTGPEWSFAEQYLAGVSFAYTQRAPSTIELFSNGAHLARGIFEVGDPSLDKEASWGFDLSVKKKEGIVTGGVTPFVQIFTDYINLAGTGEEEGGLKVARYENIEAEHLGFETEAALHFDRLFDIKGHELALEGQVDYVRAKERGSDNYLPRIPPLRTITRLKYGQDRFSTFVEGVFVNAQNDVAPFEIETDSYNLLNAQVEYELVENLSLFARGSNLTDEEARVHTSFLKDVAPLRGRSFLFGVRGRF